MVLLKLKNLNDVETFKSEIRKRETRQSKYKLCHKMSNINCAQNKLYEHL